MAKLVKLGDKISDNTVIYVPFSRQTFSEMCCEENY